MVLMKAPELVGALSGLGHLGSVLSKQVQKPTEWEREV